MSMVSEKKTLKASVERQVEAVKSTLRRWDPIGVLPGPGDDEGPMDEYDSYAPQVLSTLRSGCSVEEMTNHLEWIRTKAIGMTPYRTRDKVVAKELVSWWRSQLTS